YEIGSLNTLVTTLESNTSAPKLFRESRNHKPLPTRTTHEHHIVQPTSHNQHDQRVHNAATDAIKAHAYEPGFLLTVFRSLSKLAGSTIHAVCARQDLMVSLDMLVETVSKYRDSDVVADHPSKILDSEKNINASDFVTKLFETSTKVTVSQIELLKAFLEALTSKSPHIASLLSFTFDKYVGRDVACCLTSVVSEFDEVVRRCVITGGPRSMDVDAVIPKSSWGWDGGEEEEKDASVPIVVVRGFTSGNCEKLKRLTRDTLITGSRASGETLNV
ncbi:hypothetical protein HK096_000067, partial [Nowakowskiella sp. JEL0078]